MNHDPLHILRTMPHGHPMLLIDAVSLPADAAGSVVDCAIGFKNITFNEPCYSHAADATSLQQLAYPLALLVESFGQSAGLLLAQRGFLAAARSSFAVVFAEFRDIEIVGDAYPGDRLCHSVQIEQCHGPLAVLSGSSHVGKREIVRFGRLTALRVATRGAT